MPSTHTPTRATPTPRPSSTMPNPSNTTRMRPPLLELVTAASHRPRSCTPHTAIGHCCDPRPRQTASNAHSHTAPRPAHPAPGHGLTTAPPTDPGPDRHTTRPHDTPCRRHDPLPDRHPTPAADTPPRTLRASRRAPPMPPAHHCPHPFTTNRTRTTHPVADAATPRRRSASAATDQHHRSPCPVPPRRRRDPAAAPPSTRGRSVQPS